MFAPFFAFFYSFLLDFARFCFFLLFFTLVYSLFTLCLLVVLSFICPCFVFFLPFFTFCFTLFVLFFYYYFVKNFMRLFNSLEHVEQFKTRYQTHYANDADELKRYELFKKSKTHVAKLNTKHLRTMDKLCLRKSVRMEGASLR